MASGSIVFILTHPEDSTARAVGDELERRGTPVVLFDPASFPQEAKLTGRSEHGHWRVRIWGPTIDMPLDDLTSVWLRRPGLFRFHPGITSAERSFAMREAQMAVGGLLRTLDC